jgi:hypothetical protein
MTEGSEPKLQRTVRLVDKWMTRLGFSGFKATVRALHQASYGSCFALSNWNIEEEWVVMEFMPDGILPKDVQEAVVIHEVAHGLAAMAQAGDSTEETMCWRVARAFKQKAAAPNEWMEPHTEWWLDGTKPKTAAARLSFKEALPLMLNDEENELYRALYAEQLAPADLARELGVDRATVRKRTVALHKKVAALQHAWNEEYQSGG